MAKKALVEHLLFWQGCASSVLEGTFHGSYSTFTCLYEACRWKAIAGEKAIELRLPTMGGDDLFLERVLNWSKDRVGSS